MYENKKILAIIPMRKGSKRLPDKNIRKMCGVPMWEWTFIAAERSRYVDWVMVSTDYERGDLRMGNGDLLGPRYYRRRSIDLCQDDTLLCEVATSIIKEHTCDIVVMLQPTSPLRTEEHIDLAIHQYFDMKEKPLASITSEDFVTKEGDRICTPVRNGAIYIKAADDIGEFRAESTFYMLPEFSIDIDTLWEFNVAECLMEKRNRSISKSISGAGL